MLNERMKNWDIGDFEKHFRQAAGHSSPGGFRDQLLELADSLEPLDREFIRESAQCGYELGAVVEELNGIGGRLGYCTSDRGFPGECHDLQQEVGRVAEHVQNLDRMCFV